MSSLAAGFEKLCDRCASLLVQPRFYLWGICLSLYLYFTGHLNADPDLFARIAAGRLIELLGGVSWKDPFSYTPVNKYWIDHEWLSGWIFYRVAGIGGDWGLFLFKTCIAWYSVVLLSRAQRAAGKSTGAAPFFLGLAVLQSAAIWTSTVRAQVFTYLFLPLELLAFAEYQNEKRIRYLVLLPPVMLIWCNLHGGFVVGLGFLFLFWLTVILRRRKKTLLLPAVLLVSLAAATVNPYGLMYLKYIFKAVRMGRPAITEWAPVMPWSPTEFLFNLFVLLFFAGTLFFRSAQAEGIILCLASAYFGYRHNRLVPLFMMTSAVYGSDIFSEWLSRLRNTASGFFLKITRCFAFLFTVTSVASLICLTFFLFNRESFHLDYSSYPVGAVEWLRQNARRGCRLLVNFNHGSFALWRLYPRCRVSLDGRYEEVYPESTFSGVARALNTSDPGHGEALEAVYPDYILLDVNGSSFKNYRKFGPEWHVAYRDESFAVLGREASADHAPKAVTGSFNTPVWQPGF